MNKTRLSLFYLGFYLVLIGLGLLFAPQGTLKVLQSNRDYGDIFPRFAGMLMSGMGLSIFGMIRARSVELYPATLFIRMYFIACFVAFYVMTHDPLFLVLVGIVGLGFVLTLAAYLLDRKSSKKWRGLTGIATALAISLTGCVSPVAMHRAVMEYDRTASRIEAELLLLNVTRARHHRHLHFTAISNVAATFDFRSSAGFSGELFEGVFSGEGQGFTKNFYSFNLGASVAENPTINIIPIQGEEFTKRILAPIDEIKFGFLFHRAVFPAMLLRLMTHGIVVEQAGTDAVSVLPNNPSLVEGYREFRRRVMHLSALSLEHKLHVGSLVYEEVWPLPLDHPLTPKALEKGYRWTFSGEGQASLLTRQVIGRVAITNYDPARLPNEERRRLHEESERYPPDHILVDIRPGSPGGTYPLRGRIQLRSFQAILGFLSEGIADNPEFDVEKDPRTGPVLANPRRTLEIIETTAPPSEAAIAVEFESHWYSVRKSAGEIGDLHAWNLEAFRVLYQIFQLTVTDVGRVPTFPITIAK